MISVLVGTARYAMFLIYFISSIWGNLGLAVQRGQVSYVGVQGGRKVVQLELPDTSCLEKLVIIAID